MIRWYADNGPQHMLQGSAARAFGTNRANFEQISKPVTGEAPTSA